MASEEDSTECFNKVPPEYSGSCNVADRILLAEGEKFHVNSGFLSVHSEYFKTLFNGEFKEKNAEEIELKDVTADELRIFLKLIYPGRFEITRLNYVSLIKLSFRFLATDSLDSCRLFIEKNFVSLDKLDLLGIGFEYNLNYIKDKVANFFKEQTLVLVWYCEYHPDSASIFCCGRSTIRKGYPISKESFIFSKS